MSKRPRGWPVVVFAVLFGGFLILTIIGAVFYFRGPQTSSRVIQQPGVTTHITETVEPNAAAVILPAVPTVVFLLIFLFMRSRWRTGMLAEQQASSAIKHAEPAMAQAANRSPSPAPLRPQPPLPAVASSAADTFSFRCLHCGRSIKAPTKLRGKSVACPACKHPVTIPG